MDIELRCNQQPCRKPVTDKAVVVSSLVLSLLNTELNDPICRLHVRVQYNTRKILGHSSFSARLGSHIFCSTFSERNFGDGD